MLTPARKSPDERGKGWLQARTQQLLAEGAVVLATPHADGAPVCYWGTGPETETTLYFLLASDPDPKAVYFSRIMIMQCGSGLYSMQHNAIMLIRRTLKKMGILSA